MSGCTRIRSLCLLLMFPIVLCTCATSFATISFSSSTLTYSSPGDLSTTIDPSGQKEVTNSYGVAKASFQALNPQIVAFNSAPTASQTLRTLVANYEASNTVTFTFPSVMYNYGSATSVGRGSFSGSNARHAISTVPVQNGGLYDWLDATITSTGGRGVQSLGFCAAFRNDQAVSAGQILYTLSDASTEYITLPTLGGSGNPEYIFIGYTAPTGKTITRVQASRTSGAGGGYVSLDDLSFVMSPPPTVTLSRNNASIAEAAGVCTLTATMDRTSSQTVTVNLGYTGTASQGTDYTAANSITITAGNLSGTTNITATQDTLYEGNETVIVDITSVTNAEEQGTQQVSTSITDDDSQPSVTLSRNNATIAEAAGVSTLTATLSNASTQNVTVNLAYTGTATGGGTDYTAAASITVNAGSLTGATDITAVQDSSIEGNETIIVDISSVTNGTESGTQQVTVTITDDDSGGGSTIVALKRDSGLTAGGATDARFNGATVVTVTVADAGLSGPSDWYWFNYGAATTGGSNNLFKFNLGSIPTGSTINLAQLRLYHTGGNGALGNGDVSMVLAHDWMEGTQTGGYPGAAGGVSTAHPIGYNTGAYQNASGGGTAPLQSWGTTNDQFFSLSVDAGSPIAPSSAPTGTGYHVFDVTGHVQQWVSGTKPNYGWANASGYWDFHMSEAGTAYQPVLFVDYTGSDTTPPAAVSNLAAGSPTASSLTLTWTAPGDDGSTGTAASYDIRYSTSTINEGNWASATQVTGEPAPTAAGTNQNMVVSGLSAGTTYYFAMKTSDEIPNVSALSNVASGATSAPVQSIVALKRNSGLDTSGAIDSRFLTATVRTVTVADAPLGSPSDWNWFNYGALAIGGSNLYKFDLSSIPTGSTVSLAQLRLYHTGGNGGLGNGDVSIILTHDWMEGTMTGGYPGATGGVSTAHPIGYNTGAYQNASGGASAPTQSWGPGSDSFFSLTVDAGSPIAPSSAPVGVGYHVYDVTSHVQQWISGTKPNYGWGQYGGYWDFHCSEAGTAYQPVLFVDYTSGGGGSDTTAPAAVANLAAGSPTTSSLTLTWTAPGDDGSTGTAASYDIRYSTSTITTGNWASATPVTGKPAPLAAGSNQSMMVSGLTANTTYYFAMKTADEVPNWSALSNVASGTTTNSSGNNKPILGQSDFVYQGYYIVQRNGDFPDLNYGQGFTHRYVAGQLRFLTYAFFGNYPPPTGGHQLVEFAPPAGGFGGTVTTRTNHWPDIFGSTGMAFGNGVWGGLWYEQAQERLWTTWAIDYPDDVQMFWTKTFVVRTLNSNGTVSNVQGPWGLQGIGQRRIYGGVVAIPSWFQSTYGAPAYGAGWGGYSSRQAQGLCPALGPTFYAFPEPTGYPVGDIPTTAYKTIMDHGDGIYGADWYANGFPTSFDRGVRNTDVDNDYDTPYWQSPAPDGLGRWTWGDSNWNTGCWIETPTKQGFITVPKLGNGRTWYETSTLHCERGSAEIQVFDPNMLGQVAQGTRAVWNTYPTNRWEITSTIQPLGFNWGHDGNGPYSGPAGASYDATTQTLYIYCIWGTNANSYILVYHVN